MSGEATKGKYILYADDDFEDQEMLKEVVGKIDSNLNVVTTNGGCELLSYLETLQPGDSLPCLIVIDMNMPKMDGIEVLKQLKSLKTYLKLPVVIFSTSDNQATIQMAKTLGAIDYIKKPVSFDSFLQVAKQFLDLCETVPDQKNR